MDENRFIRAIEALTEKMGDIVERIARLETKIESHVEHGKAIARLERDLVSLQVKFAVGAVVISALVTFALRKLGLS